MLLIAVVVTVGLDLVAGGLLFEPPSSLEQEAMKIKLQSSIKILRFFIDLIFRL